MTDSPTINPAPPDDHGLDYAWLKDEGTRLVQDLAGDIWTDYNEHDPGVTTLEQLCYALTDLAYRAALPLRDLLMNRPGGRIDTRRQALFIPRRILPCNPVTQNDYRKLIVDRVEGIANCWFLPHPPTPGTDDVRGLYDILLYAPGADHCCEAEFQPDALRASAKRVYCRHRNLCEDVHAIDVLEPLTARVAAVATIDDSRAPEAILAALMFNIGNFLAPELPRQPLDALIARGLPTDAIFNGPLPRHGFIDDEALQPKATEVAVASIVRVMARTEGVIGLRGVSVRVGERDDRYAGAASIPVPPDRILQLDTRPGPDGFPIRLWRNGIEMRPDPARVRRELERLWSAYRRTYPLTPQYEQHFAVPAGRFHHLAAYYSIQNQYPNVYGINAFGLSDNPGPARKGQAKQLKGYLLAFEQLLADFFAQLAHVKDLYSSERHLEHTYFYHLLDRSVPDVAPLLRHDYARGLARIVQGHDPAVERRSRFIDLLLALYGEALDGAMLAGPHAHGEPSATRLLHAKLALLRVLVVSTRDRGRGFDYLARAWPHNVAGMAIKSRIQLGMEPFESRPRADVLAEFALEIVDTDEEASIGRTLSAHADHIEENFAIPDAGDPDAARPQVLNGHRVTEEFVIAASALENFRIGTLPGESEIVLVCKSGGDTQWRFVGRYADEATARRTAVILVGQATVLHHGARQLYIVEHTLLRYGRDRPGEDDAEAAPEPPGAPAAGAPLTETHERPPPPFVYDFTITAVLSERHGYSDHRDYRARVHEVIRANAPAHIAVDYCFLHPRRMRRFEERYGAWRHALRHGNPEQIAYTSARLRRFLQRRRHRDHAALADTAALPEHEGR